VQNTRTKPEKTEAVYEMPQKVGVIYSDVRRDYFLTEAQYITEKDADKDARLISDYLEQLGLTVYLYSGNARLPERLRRDKPELVINLVDSVKGDESLSSAIPGVLELLNIPYTGPIYWAYRWTRINSWSKNCCNKTAFQCPTTSSSTRREIT